MRQRVAHLRHGLSPVIEVVTKKGSRVAMHTPGDSSELTYQADVQMEQCLEEPILDEQLEEYDVELTKKGMIKELNAMKDFDVYEEMTIHDSADERYAAALPTMLCG